MRDEQPEIQDQPEVEDLDVTDEDAADVKGGTMPIIQKFKMEPS